MGLDVSPLLARIQAVAGRPGQPAIDPRILLSLWLLAPLDGVGSARELDRLTRQHLAYEWLCGTVSVNYHTLSDFRSQNGEFLSGLLTQSVATLLHEGLVDRAAVAQDGWRASAGPRKGFRRVGEAGKPSRYACSPPAHRPREEKNRLPPPWM